MPNQYRYEEQPLGKKIAERLILTIFAGAPKIKREYIVKGVIEYHKSQGGLPPNSSVEVFISEALASLRNMGYAEQLGSGYWRVLPIYDSE